MHRIHRLAERRFAPKFIASTPMRTLMSALGCTVLILMVACSSARAQSSLNLSPMLVELTAAPGTAQDFAVTLVNESSTRPAHVRIYVTDVGQRSDGEYSILDKGTSPWSCAGWMELGVQEAIVEAKRSLTVTCKLKVPRGASGGRYAAIVFELVPEKPVASAVVRSTVIQKFVAIVELSIPARQVKKALTISEFSVRRVEENSVAAQDYGSSAVIFAAEVKNEGDIHVAARGRIILRDGQGKRLREMPLGGGRCVVLPGAAINLRSVLRAGLSPGDYVAEVTVDYGVTRPARVRVPFRIDELAVEAGVGDMIMPIANLSVEPTELDLAYPAGATAARSLIVENQSSQVIRVEGRALDLSFDEDGDLVLDGIESASASCADWVELRPSSFELKPGARQVVRMVIAIPKGVSGGRYANVAFSSAPVAQGGHSSDPVWSGENGTVVFLRVGTVFDAQGELDPISIVDSAPSTGMVFRTVFRNVGNIHVKPTSSMILKKRVMPKSVEGMEYIGTGQLVVVDSLDLGEEATVVLPGGSRALNVALNTRPDPGDYVVEFVVGYGGETPLVQTLEFTVD